MRLKSHRTAAFLTCAAIVTTMSSSVMADGINSKGKSRIPLSGDYLGAIEGTILGTMYDLPANKKVVLALMVNRNARAAQRRNKWYGEKPVQKSAIAAPTQIIPDDGTDISVRERMVLRHQTTAKVICGGLHTHERNVCLQQAQVQKMERAVVTK